MTVKGKASWAPGFWGMSYATDNPNAPIVNYGLNIENCVGTLLRVRWRDLESSQGTYTLDWIDNIVQRYQRAGKYVGIQLLTTGFGKTTTSTDAPNEAPNYIASGPGGSSLNGGGTSGSYGFIAPNDKFKRIPTVWREWPTHGFWVQERLKALLTAMRNKWGDVPAFHCILGVESIGFLPWRDGNGRSTPQGSAPDIGNSKAEYQAAYKKTVISTFKKMREGWPEVMISWPLNYVAPATEAQALEIINALKPYGIGISSPDGHQVDKGRVVIRMGRLWGQIPICPMIQPPKYDKTLAGNNWDISDLFNNMVRADNEYRCTHIFWTFEHGAGLYNWTAPVKPTPSARVAGPTVPAGKTNYDLELVHRAKRSEWLANNRQANLYYRMGFPSAWTDIPPPDTDPDNPDNPDPDPEPVEQFQEIRINCGGIQVLDQDGKPFIADQFFGGRPDSGQAKSFTEVPDNSGTLFHIPNSVAQTYREVTPSGTGEYDPNTYAVWRLSMTPGQHRVNLVFNEPFFTTVGQRIFSYVMQETPDNVYLTNYNFDIIKEAGARYKTLVKSHVVTVAASGKLDIFVVNQKNRALLNGIYVQANADPGGLGIPTITGAVALSGTSVRLTITPGIGTPTGYRVFVNGRFHGTYSATNTITVLGLPEYQALTFEVSAFTNTPAYRESERSNGRTLTTPDQTKPTPPTLLLVTQDGTSRRLMWQPSTDSGSGISHYNVYRNDGLGGPYTKIGEAEDAEEPRFIDTAPGAGDPLYYVTAVDMAGNESLGSNADDAGNIAPTANNFSTFPLPVINVITLSGATDPNGDELFIKEFDQLQAGTIEVTEDSKGLIAVPDPSFLGDQQVEIIITDQKGGDVPITMTLKSNTVGAPFIL